VSIVLKFCGVIINFHPVRLVFIYVLVPNHRVTDDRMLKDILSFLRKVFAVNQVTLSEVICVEHLPVVHHDKLRVSEVSLQTL
jgi:hypothetical protein